MKRGRRSPRHRERAAAAAAALALAAAPTLAQAPGGRPGPGASTAGGDTATSAQRATAEAPPERATSTAPAERATPPAPAERATPPAPARRAIPPAPARRAIPPAPAERATLNFSGVPGLVDMPSAAALPDGELATTFSYFGHVSRTTLTFQFTPRLSGSFRYAGVGDWDDVRPSAFDTYYDRSFDLRYQILREGPRRPAVAVGLQDFVGTGLFSAEYLVASKTFGPVTVTGGLGWGRLGSFADLGTPFGDRPALDIEEGGEANLEQLFQGPAAPFAGIAWRPTRRLTLLAEYSSDAYDRIAGRREVFDRDSPVNFGVEYRVNEALTLGAYSLYGSEIGVAASVAVNPRRPPAAGSYESAPTPVEPRPARSAEPEAWSPEWIVQDGAREILRGNLSRQLAEDDLALEALELGPRKATLWLRNPTYGAEAEAVGRAARAMTRVLPASVETFRIVPVADGLPLSAVVVARSDLEALEWAPRGPERLLAATEVEDAGRRPPRLAYPDDLYPAFDWSVGPYTQVGLFDPAEPVRADAGVEASARYAIAPGLAAQGTVTKRVVGNLDELTRGTSSELPRVRSNFPRYIDEGDPALTQLTLGYQFRPGANLYGRVNGGYLERMFGGLSGELLWKPVESPLALGAEVSYARQRDFDGGFGLRDYDTVTGHLSAYYDFGSGYLGRIHAGRYLAGDWGATLALDREFANGWRVGAFATFTDASDEEFGEGSFDKGIRLSIPLEWFSNTPSRRSFSRTVRPITGDGGARLAVPNRLYGQVRDYHAGELAESWGRVWR